jgi:hypothetical protein
MSLTMQMFHSPLQRQLANGAPPRYQTAHAEGGFAKYIDNIEAEREKYSKIPLDQIETRMETVKTVDEHGNVKEIQKEMAVCPECGETNCPCIARITVQARLDEANASGVRYADQERPKASVIPQTFNQLSMNMEMNSSKPRVRF